MNHIAKLVLLIVILVVQTNLAGSGDSCSSACPECSWALSLDVEHDPILSIATKTCCFSQCDYYPWCLEVFDWHNDYSITVERENQMYLMANEVTAVVRNGIAVVCMEGTLDVVLASSEKNDGDVLTFRVTRMPQLGFVNLMVTVGCQDRGT